MINQERLKEIEGKALISGTGADIDHACVMQMVSYIANEPWSDRPVCACETLTSYAIKLNDRFPFADRQKLIPLIPLLVGTRGDFSLRVRRAKFLTHWMLTQTFPILTDLIKLPEISAKLRATENSKEGFLAARDFLRANKEVIRNAAYAADADAAAAAAAYAAYAAAAAAAYAADAAAADAAAAAAYAAYAAADAAAYAAAAAAYAAAYAAADAAAAAAYAAYAAADAAAYAAAYAVKIRESSIEGLRLACEVK